MNGATLMQKTALVAVAMLALTGCERAATGSIDEGSEVDIDLDSGKITVRKP